MKKYLLILSLALALALAGCIFPGQPLFSISPNPVTVTYTANHGQPVVLTANQSTISGSYYVSIADPAGVIQAIAPTAYSFDKATPTTINASTSSSIAAGHYTGQLSINVCSDAACAIAVRGSPVKVPYDITVSPDPLALSAWPGVADWSTYQGNAGHTGYVPVTLNPASFALRWIWGTPDVAISPVTVVNGQIYLTTSGKRLNILKEYDATLGWSFNAPSSTGVGQPAVANGKAFSVDSGNQLMYDLNASDGALLFTDTFPIASDPNSGPYYIRVPTISNGRVFVNAADGGMTAFDTLSGNKIFTSSVWGNPAADANNVYVHSGSFSNSHFVSASLKVIDPMTGNVKASIADTNTYQSIPCLYHGPGSFAPPPTCFSFDFSGAPVLGAAGSVFVMTVPPNSMAGFSPPYTRNLSNFNVGAGAQAWSISGRYGEHPAYANGVIYVATNTSPVGLEAHSETDGSLLWSWTPGSASETSVGSDVLLTDNLVFVSTNLATYALDLTTHQPVWSYPQAGSLALSANGILYIDNGHQLFAINVK
jgi:outer membrane protein assembly factor BamB